MKVVAVASVDNKQVVRDTLADRFGADVKEHAVAPLTDAEKNQIVKTFGELAKLGADPRSRELLRRLVVVDLLVRGGVGGVPLSDADAMREVWSGLVRRRGMSDRGSPDAREWVLLRLAAPGAPRCRRHGEARRRPSSGFGGARRITSGWVLRVPPDDAFEIGPEFEHDEVRRYAVARLLLLGRDPASRITGAGAPRWSLPAARLACQALLAEPNGSANPLRGRFATLQKSFDAIVAAGHATRWGDVPGEAMLRLGNPNPVLRDAWPVLQADDAAELRRLARLVAQRLCTDGIVDIVAVEPVITLLLEDSVPWRRGEYAQRLLRDWLQAHVMTETPDGHPLRVLLRQRLVAACSAAERRAAEERKAAVAARAARTPEDLAEERRHEKSHRWLMSEIGPGSRRRRQRPEIPPEITDQNVIELLALLGSDIGEDGEAIFAESRGAHRNGSRPRWRNCCDWRRPCRQPTRASGCTDRSVLPRRRRRRLSSLRRWNPRGTMLDISASRTLHGISGRSCRCSRPISATASQCSTACSIMRRASARAPSPVLIGQSRRREPTTFAHIRRSSRSPAHVNSTWATNTSGAGTAGRQSDRTHASVHYRRWSACVTN